MSNKFNDIVSSIHAVDKIDAKKSHENIWNGKKENVNQFMISLHVHSSEI